MGNNAFMGIVLLFILILAVAGASASAVSLRLIPHSINTITYETFMGHIEIDADDSGSYSLHITGVPDTWLEYPSTVDVNGKTTVNYMITPAEPGVYDLSFIISGPSGDDEVVAEMWVGAESGGSQSYAQTGASAKKGLPSSGMFSVGEQDWMLIDIAAAVIAAIFAALLGYATLRRESV
ncbi:MAG: hypothetical protein J7K54_02860 [Candidatus Aenigmarchaeota archaeon]|nr:hypothetical protein [Candidatus Aenigmarchaeota archaeon]